MSKVPTPRPDEPIRLVRVKGGDARYRVTLDAGPHPGTGKRRQLTSTHKTLAEARRYVHATKADLARGTFTTPNRQTFGAYAAEWLERRRRSPKVRAVTAASYEGVLRHGVRAFGSKPLASVTRTDVESVVARLDAAGRSRRTAALTLFVIRSVLKDALGEGLVVRNVAASVEATGRPARPRDELSSAELAALRSHLSTDRLYAAWLATLYGLRRSEVMELRWSDVDLDVGTLSIARSRVAVDGKAQDVGDPKTDRGKRTLPLPSDLAAALRDLRMAQMAAHGFAHVRDGYLAVDEIGRPIRPERWSDLWCEHVEAAGIEAGKRRLTLHCARHSSVMAMRRAKIPDRVIAEWHGHSEATMIAVYGRHTQTAELSEAGKALSAAMS